MAGLYSGQSERSKKQSLITSISINRSAAGWTLKEIKTANLKLRKKTVAELQALYREEYNVHD